MHTYSAQTYMRKTILINENNKKIHKYLKKKRGALTLNVSSFNCKENRNLFRTEQGPGPIITFFLPGRENAGRGQEPQLRIASDTLHFLEQVL